MAHTVNLPPSSPCKMSGPELPSLLEVGVCGGSEARRDVPAAATAARAAHAEALRPFSSSTHQRACMHAGACMCPAGGRACGAVGRVRASKAANSMHAAARAAPHVRLPAILCMPKLAAPYLNQPTIKHPAPPQQKLQSLGLESTPEEFVESLPAPVRARVEALQGIQDKHDEVESAFRKERAELEAKYERLYGEASRQCPEPQLSARPQPWPWLCTTALPPSTLMHMHMHMHVPCSAQCARRCCVRARARGAAAPVFERAHMCTASSQARAGSRPPKPPLPMCTPHHCPHPSPHTQPPCMRSARLSCLGRRTSRRRARRRMPAAVREEDKRGAVACVACGM